MVSNAKIREPWMKNTSKYAKTPLIGSLDVPFERNVEYLWFQRVKSTIEDGSSDGSSDNFSIV